jgi:hypothetical protein
LTQRRTGDIQIDVRRLAIHLLILVILATLLLAGAAIVVGRMQAMQALAHGWYEASCCSDRDCRPVPDEFVEETKAGVVVKGHGTLSSTDPRLRWSRDQRTHLCEEPGKLLCVYRKPPSM